MKKYLFLSVMSALFMTSCSAIAPAASTQSTTQSTTTQTTQQSSQNVLGDILGGLANAGVSATTDNGGTLGGVLGNILSSVTGSLTTTQANLVGTWTYQEPSVQFESENLLAQAGGTAAASTVENKLASVYRMVGITAGKLVFTFANDGNVNYTLGSRTFSGTYVFDANNKTVVITTTTGMNITAFVTVSGNYMSLCFDSSKVLTLFQAAGNLSNSSSTLGNIASIAQNFKGMKTGFKFVK